MNAKPIKTAAQYLAGWATVILFVVLLTLIFSFLGAFFCAALGGMMVGSVKIPRWQSVTLSLTFPAVLCGILRAGRAELLNAQLVLLAVLCLGTFWLTYLVVRAVVWYERKATPAGSAASGPGVPGQAQAAQTSAPNPVFGHLNLDLLQGQWSSAGVNGHAQEKRKVMEIKQQQLLLTIRNAAGEVSFLGEGQISLVNHRAVGLSTLCRPTQEVDDCLVSI